MKIDKGVPIPPRRIPLRGGPIKWEFQALEVGDSFAVVVPPEFTPSKFLQKIRAEAVRWRRYANRPEFRFQTRVIPEGGRAMVRFWRDPDASQTDARRHTHERVGETVPNFLKPPDLLTPAPRVQTPIEVPAPVVRAKPEALAQRAADNARVVKGRRY